MCRARSPDSIKAEGMYHKGMPLVDIAKQLQVPDGTVRRWKSTQQWEKNAPQKGKKKQDERSGSKASARKRGAPVGNSNSKGHTNRLKHGGYSPIYWDTLDEEEKAMIDNIETDPEKALKDQIILYTLRERRLMKLIKKYTDDNAKVSMQYMNRLENKREFDGTDDEKLIQKQQYDEMVADEIAQKKRKPGRNVQLQTQTENKDALIARLEDQLTRCSSAKNKCIAELAALQMEKAKRELEAAGNDTVNDWIAGVMAEGGGFNE
ncbi:MAG: hypothetical protein K6G83_01965 [Lachnospiraceae bacterium]|nr:hypothetical protein [Lachnospiraceae bacterium]